MYFNSPHSLRACVVVVVRYEQNANILTLSLLQHVTYKKIAIHLQKYKHVWSFGTF